MHWIGISGSWRKINKQLESDVRYDVAGIMASGKGLVTGGALGTDYIATDEALIHNPAAIGSKSSCRHL